MEEALAMAERRWVAGFAVAAGPYSWERWVFVLVVGWGGAFAG